MADKKPTSKPPKKSPLTEEIRERPVQDKTSWEERGYIREGRETKKKIPVEKSTTKEGDTKKQQG